MRTYRSDSALAAAAAKTEVLIEALPWLKRFHGEIVVVKFGGNAMIDEELAHAFAEDMVYLRLAGVQPVVVHGGGPQISRALEQAGIPSEFRGGYRYTSEPAMAVVRDVLVDEVGAGLVAAINAHGDFAASAPGDRAGLFTGSRMPGMVDGESVDLGLVGEVTEVNAEAVRAALAAGRVPVISTVATEDGGDGILNVNADAAAAALAIELGAAKLMVLTDVEGLYADWPNRDSILSVIETDDLRAMLPGLESGMIPKMTACLAAVDGGVPKAAIIDGRRPHSILLEVFTTSGVGTEVVPS